MQMSQTLDELATDQDTLFSLELRRNEILSIMRDEPITREQADEYILELAEIETSLQSTWAVFDDISDERMCLRFETSL